MFYFMSRKRENQESVLNRRGIFKKGTGRKNLNANPKMYSLNFVIVHFFSPYLNSSFTPTNLPK